MRHIRIHVLKILYPCLEIWLGGYNLSHLEPLEALEHCGDGSVRHLECLDNPDDSSVWEKVFTHRILHHNVILRDGTDEAVLAVGLIYESH